MQSYCLYVEVVYPVFAACLFIVGRLTRAWPHHPRGVSESGPKKTVEPRSTVSTGYERAAGRARTLLRWEARLVVVDSRS